MKQHEDLKSYCIMHPGCRYPISTNTTNSQGNSPMKLLYQREDAIRSLEVKRLSTRKLQEPKKKRYNYKLSIKRIHLKVITVVAKQWYIEREINYKLLKYRSLHTKILDQQYRWIQEKEKKIKLQFIKMKEFWNKHNDEILHEIFYNLKQTFYELVQILLKVQIHGVTRYLNRKL